MSYLSKWRSAAEHRAPHWYPADREHLRALPDTRAVRKGDLGRSPWAAAVERIAGPRLHLDLIPKPFVGDVSRARVILLLSNPGVSPGDYYAETRVPGYSAAVRANLASEAGRAYPFFFLNPEFSWHPGFRWWKAKLGGLIEKYRKVHGMSGFASAAKRVAQQIAVLELMPYHSGSFPGGKWAVSLPSVVAAREHLHESILPRAKRGKLLVVALRGVKGWELDEYRSTSGSVEGVVAVPHTHARGASLSPEGRVGRAVFSWLK